LLFIGNGEWDCNGRTIDGDGLLEIINESEIESQPLLEALNEFSDIVYWEDDNNGFHTTPAPDEANFNPQIRDLHEQMENLIKFHMSDKGLISEDCQRIQMLLAVNEVEHSINGCLPEDFKSFNK
jgi:hypothetical protein